MTVGDGAASRTGPRYDLILRDVCPWGDGPSVDIAIQNGVIAQVGPALDGAARDERRLYGRPVLPAFIEPHIHLDKAFTVRDAGGSSGVAEASDLAAALLTDGKATATPLEERAARLLSQLQAHGVCMVRSHINVGPTIGLGNLERILAVAERFRPGLETQVVAFAERAMEPGADGWNLLHQALDMGCVAVGGSTTHRPDPEPFVAGLFEVAARGNRNVDIHVDEHTEPHCSGLRALVHHTRNFDYRGRVLAGHCCALAVADAATRAHLIVEMADLEIALTVLPLTNLYLQGRPAAEAGGGTVPGLRGLAPVRELLCAGVRVLCGSDNVQDPFLPYGNGDPLLALTVLGVAAQLTSARERAWLQRAMTSEAAAALCMRDHGLAPGCAANLVVLDAVPGSLPVTAPAPKALVLHGGEIFSAGQPSRHGED